MAIGTFSSCDCKEAEEDTPQDIFELVLAGSLSDMIKIAGLPSERLLTVYGWRG